MLTITQIATQAVRDYYIKMSRHSKDRSYWYGQGSVALGYQAGDPVDEEVLYALCAVGKGFAKDFEAGHQAQYAVNDILKHQATLERPRIPGRDLTFGADKSMSVIYLVHPDEAVRNAASVSHYLAVLEALRFIEKKAGVARITKNGQVSPMPSDLVFAVFTHFTNRNLEPHLHSHALLPNTVRGEDGKWRALDSKDLYGWYMAAGAVYRAACRTHMKRLTNVKWVAANGWKYEIAGLSEWVDPQGNNTLKTVSTRTSEVKDAIEQAERKSPTGRISPRVRRSMATQTRKAKDFGHGDAAIDEIAAELRRGLEEFHELGPEQLRAIIQAYDEPHPDSHVEGLWLTIPDHLEIYGAVPLVENSDDLVDYLARILFDEGGGRAKEGILSGKAFVSQEDIYAASYNLLGGFVETEVLEKAVATLIAGGGIDEKLRLMPLAAATYVAGREAPLKRVPIRFYATRGVMSSEARVLELSDAKTTSAVLDSDVVNEYIAQTVAAQRAQGGYVLAEEQQEALRHLFTSETTMTLLMGAQGSGKTTLFSHFGKLAKEHGITVWGIAPQGTAVNKLGDMLRKIDPDARSLTIESFVGQVNFGSLKIPKNTCLILDESSQVDTLELAEIVDIATQAGAKVILVGDDRQLGSVRYGGMFAALFAKLGGARMVETRRAADAYDRTAQSYLRMGDLKEALRIYDQSGRISVADDRLAFMESVSTWLGKEFDDGTDSFVITNTKTEEMAANEMAHAIWDSHRQEWYQDYLDTQVRHHRLSYEHRQRKMQRFLEADPLVSVPYAGSDLTLRTGDLVAIRRSLKIDKNTRLANGQRGRIVGITDKTVTLFIQEESRARHISIPRDLLERERNAISYGWASTVFRTQSMELGTAEGEVEIADVHNGLTPDTPVLIRRGTRLSKKTFAGDFLEDKGDDKVLVRLKNGKVKTVAKSRISLAPETQTRIERLCVTSRDGNALVIGTEGMNLDALLVAASRARQHTDFIFRSVMETENDFSGEKLLAQALDSEVAKSTLTLYLARMSRPDKPDSAYLALAREREATKLAATVDLPILGALRMWLTDNLTTGTLELNVDEGPSRAKRDAAAARLAQLESQLVSVEDPQYQAHLVSEIDACAAEIGYAEMETTRIKIFSEFVGHASHALSDKEGRVVVDERYVRDRLSLVDDAISMAEDMDSWVEVDYAIEVPLPENTSREVVDVSAKEKVELDTKAKLFSSVSYQVASDWMRLADGLYDQMLSEGLSMEQVIQKINVSDENRVRLQSAMAAVCVARAHPTPVSHPVTLRTVSDEALSEGVDPEIVAIVEEMTESIFEHRNRRAEQRSRDESAPDFTDEDDYGEFWDVYENEFPTDYGSGHWAASEDEPVPEYVEWGEDDIEQSERGEAEGEHLDSPQGVASESAEAEDTPPPPPPSVVESDGDIGGEVVNTGSHGSPEPTETTIGEKGQEEKPRKYAGGFFYKNDDGIWLVDYEQMAWVYDEMGRRDPYLDVRLGTTRAALFNVVEVREIEPGTGEWYYPEADTEMVERLEAYRARLARESEERHEGHSSSRGSGTGKGTSDGHSGGYGYGTSR